MVEVNIIYEGSLRCVATHGPSGITLATDAPVVKINPAGCAL